MECRLHSAMLLWEAPPSLDRLGRPNIDSLRCISPTLRLPAVAESVSDYISSQPHYADQMALCCSCKCDMQLAVRCSSISDGVHKLEPASCSLTRLAITDSRNRGNRAPLSVQLP